MPRFQTAPTDAMITGRVKKPMDNLDENVFKDGIPFLGFCGEGKLIPGVGLISDKSLTKWVLHIGTWVTALVMVCLVFRDVTEDKSDGKEAFLPQYLRDQAMVLLIGTIVAIAGIVVAGVSAVPATMPLINSIGSGVILMCFWIVASMTDRLMATNGAVVTDTDGVEHTLDLVLTYRYAFVAATLFGFGLAQVMNYIIYTIVAPQNEYATL
ncbi:MAG: hypothetical protein CMA06_03310 [Euryarchaeota archaeon]|nr:hypothetical protein [Euryarchaeota archaeon]|tara:strand:+ start:3403 stop:4035 length:633 start_codon:yes stop_codon:yes gene_type:complete